MSPKATSYQPFWASSSALHVNFSCVVVLVSSGETLNRGLQNIGSIFLGMKTLSNSLGTGLDKLEEKPNVLRPPRHKAERSVRELQLPLKASSVCLACEQAPKWGMGRRTQYFCSQATEWSVQ